MTFYVTSGGVPAVLIALFRLRVMHWVSEPLVQQQLLLSRGEVSALAVLVLLTGGIGGLIVPLVFLRTSRSLHDAMLERVSRAPMSFFISNPVGRILNRFSKDTAVADSVFVKQAI